MRLLKSSKVLMAGLSFCALAIVLTCFSACSVKPEKPLRVATNLWPGYEPLYLAKSVNLYKDVTVKLFRMPSSSAVLSAFRNKRVDIAALTLDEVLLLQQDGLDIKVILVMDTSNGGDAIIAHDNIKSMADLKGKRVGVESSALGAFVLSRALELSGLSPKDIEVVSLTVDAHEKAFVENRVDAVVTFEPVRGKLLSKGGRVIFDSKKIPNEIFDVLVVHNDVIKSRNSDVRSLLESWFGALEYMRANPVESNKIMAAMENISSADFESSLKLIAIPDRKENIRLLTGSQPGLIAPGKKLSKIMLDKKLLSRKVDIAKLLPEKALVKE